jgi:hypothetical protein
VDEGELNQRDPKLGQILANTYSIRNAFIRTECCAKVGPNSAHENLAAPGVRIRLAPPHSLACFPTLWRGDEIGAWGAIHARPWTRRMPTAAAERENRLKFSVRDFGMSICEPADILRRSVLGKNAA